MWSTNFEISQERIRINHKQNKEPNIRHHEQVESKQKAFVKQVEAMTSTLEEMGNPFLEESEDLLVLDTRDIADTNVATTIRNIEQIGKDKYHEYVRDRLDKRTKPLSDPYAELIKCGYKRENGCRGWCKCVKAALNCTSICKCGGQCDRE